MAKTKAGGRNNPYRRRSKSQSPTSRNLQNGLYVHSSPPKAMNGYDGKGSASIREYIRAGNVEALEEMVLEGEGAKLLSQHATDNKIRAFLKTVPSYISKIDLLHDSVEKGNLRDLKSLLDRRKLARAKDAQGVSLLHKAVIHSNADIVEYLLTDYPETAEVTDNDGRTALHYSAASKEKETMYSIVSRYSNVTELEDNKGKVASYYMENPGELNDLRKRVSKPSGGSRNRKQYNSNRRASYGYKISTPPKREGLNITGANIRIWIHDQDLARLEMIVLEGHGQRLLNETSNHTKVRQFLNLVPRMMTKHKEIHMAAITGDKETLEAKADQPEVLLAKDKNGLTALHKAAAHGHVDVCEWICQKNSNAVNAADRRNRTPIFFATIPTDGGETWEVLTKYGANPEHKDKYNKTAVHYRGRPGDIDIEQAKELPLAPRSGSSNLDVPLGSRMPSTENSRAPSRANGRSRKPSRRNSLTSDPTGRTRGRNNLSTDPPGRDPSRRRNQKNSKEKREEAMEMQNMRNVTDQEIDKFIQKADISSLEYVILSGRGADLRGRSSWNEQLRRYLKKAPALMGKMSQMHEASADGDIKTVQKLTKENPKLAMALSEEGANPLHFAAYGGHPHILKHLIDTYPSGIHFQDENQRTPLFWAAISRQSGAHETYDLLQKEGSYTEGVDMKGLTADEYFSWQGPIDSDPGIFMDRKKKKTSKKKGNSLAPSRNHSRAASRADSRRNSFNADNDPDGSIKKALEDAEKGKFNGLNEVIVRGDGEKLVPLKSKDEEVQDFLNQVPRHLESINEIHQQAEEGNTRNVFNLIDRKHKAYVQDSNHANILHKAVLHGHSGMARDLAKRYPDLMNKQDKAGRTPLHYAAVAMDGGHIYKILEKKDAKSLPDNDGRTPEDYLRDPSLLSHEELKNQLRNGLESQDGESARGYQESEGGYQESEGGYGDNRRGDGSYRDMEDTDGRLLPQTASTASRPKTMGSEIIYYGSDEDGMTRADPHTIQEIEEAYNKLRGSKSKSLLKKYLTREVLDKLKHRVTHNGASLLDVIRSGVENPDSNIGVYAPDAESYVLFDELFDPIIDEYHGGFSPNESHPMTDYGDSNELGDLNEFGEFVVSTRVRCARSIEGYPFNPMLTLNQYAELEQDVENSFDAFDDDLAGYYTPIKNMSEAQQQELIDEHLLFKIGDRFLEAANACRFWPDGRGIFLNSDKTLVIWVSEEDHLRIISMQKGGHLGQVYDRFVRAVKIIEDRLPFSISSRLGALSFCPTNLGTAIRASVHVKLPNLGRHPDILVETADKFSLQVRGTSGEHSEAKGFVFDISNRRRLGLTEIEALKEMYHGVKEIIALEISMQQDQDAN